jgi:hypothetical protein
MDRAEPEKLGGRARILLPMPVHRSLARDILAVLALVYVNQWSRLIREITGIEHLGPRIVLPVKGGHGVWAARVKRILWRVKP